MTHYVFPQPLRLDQDKHLGGWLWSKKLLSPNTLKREAEHNTIRFPGPRRQPELILFTIHFEHPTTESEPGFTKYATLNTLVHVIRRTYINMYKDPITYGATGNLSDLRLTGLTINERRRTVSLDVVKVP